MPFTDAEKLEVIEFFCTQWRPARSSTIEGERTTLLILKEIAKEIRARDPAAPGRAQDRLQRAIDDAKADRRESGSGYAVPKLRKIAEIAIGEWPTIRQALETYEKEINRCST